MPDSRRANRVRVCLCRRVYIGSSATTLTERRPPRPTTLRFLRLEVNIFVSFRTRFLSHSLRLRGNGIFDVVLVALALSFSRVCMLCCSAPHILAVKRVICFFEYLRTVLSSAFKKLPFVIVPLVDVVDYSFAISWDNTCMPRGHQRAVILFIVALNSP